jgi:hypothetical protein
MKISRIKNIASVVAAIHNCAPLNYAHDDDQKRDLELLTTIYDLVLRDAPNDDFTAAQLEMFNMITGDASSHDINPDNELATAQRDYLAREFARYFPASRYHSVHVVQIEEIIVVITNRDDYLTSFVFECDSDDDHYDFYQIPDVTYRITVPLA